MAGRGRATSADAGARRRERASVDQWTEPGRGPDPVLWAKRLVGWRPSAIVVTRLLHVWACKKNFVASARRLPVGIWEIL